jgi:hypothetical protein
LYNKPKLGKIYQNGKIYQVGGNVRKWGQIYQNVEKYTTMGEIIVNGYKTYQITMNYIKIDHPQAFQNIPISAFWYILV